MRVFCVCVDFDYDGKSVFKLVNSICMESREKEREEEEKKKQRVVMPSSTEMLFQVNVYMLKCCITQFTLALTLYT